MKNTMENTIIIDDAWIPATALEWFTWLSEEEQKTQKSYLAKPASMIADYRREQAITHDYEGREILELLQNAADQARENDIHGRVIIELLPEGLIVANTGAAFSVGGVQSLQTAHLSPKWRKRRLLIGNKGLGFRSVLNWTHSPIILSGTLNLSYSLTFARGILTKLVKESPELAQRVENERRLPEDVVTPLLPFPAYSKTGQIEALVEDGPAKVVLARCQEWRKEGYDTAIGMVFDKPEMHQSAQEQIHKLRPEILLFVNHLYELRFLETGADEKIWRFEGNDALSMVLENDVPLGMWQIHRTSEMIPDDHLDQDQKDDENGQLWYEIVVALPEVESTNELKTVSLFSHFPTNIELPLPVICHATLELNQSRNHTVQRKSNKYILDQLAHFLAEVAERRAKQYPIGPNAGFRIILPLKNFPNDLTRDRFPEEVLAAAKRRAIVPTLSGEAVYPENARFIRASSTAWLPEGSFPEVVALFDAEEEKFFKKLEVPVLELNDLKRRLVGLSSLTIEHRAMLIAGLLDHSVDRSVYSSALLLDTDGRQVPDETPVFLAPVGGAVSKLPDWIDLRFLHENLRSELMTRLKAQDVRDLQGKLAAFGLLEYSLANLIRRIVAAANRRKKAYPDETTMVDHDLWVTIFSLYTSETNPDKRPDYPDNAPLSLPNQDGGTSAADTLYFGSGYGTQGNIIQELYGPWAAKKIIVGPERLGITENKEELSSFLKWVHVAAWPREVFEYDPNDGYREYVLSKLRYPTKFDEYFFKSKEEIERPRLDRVHSVDGLTQILQNADSTAITAWLALDLRVHQWTRSQVTHAQLSARLGNDYNQRFYREPLPGYFRWKTENTPWLKIEGGEKVRPRDCFLGQRAIEALFPRPTKPAAEIIERYGLVESDLIEGWRRSGVLMSLAELEIEDIYSRLIELPARDPQGRSAKSLYRWLMDASDSAMGNWAVARAEFITHGKMWGHHSDIAAYYPVAELHHVDSDGLPPSLLQRLKIVDLPFRVGADKVERVFGVRAVDRSAIEQHVINSTLAADFDDEFQKAKPYLYLLRASQSSQTQYLKSLKSLSLKVCSELNASMRYDEDEFEFVPPVWGWLIDQDVLYVRSDPAEPVDVSSDLLADSIGEALASIFRIGDGGEFARIFLCKNRDRRTLIKKMRGEAAEEDMDKIIAEFGASDTVSLLAALPADVAITEPVSAEGTPVNGSQLPTQPENQTKSDFEETSGVSGEPLQINARAHQPQVQPKRTNLRVQRTTRSPHRMPGMYRVTNGDFCEKKAVEFEEGDEHPRYPLRVGLLTGTAAFGCDILSFASSEDRENFKSGACRDLRKVLRFIEVKGRKNEGGAIEIKGNQRTAAITYKERYYIYRLYKSSPDEYHLSILQAPLQQSEALESSVYVDLNRAKATQQFSLKWGMQEDLRIDKGDLTDDSSDKASSDEQFNDDAFRDS